MNFGIINSKLKIYQGCTHVNNIEVVELVKRKDTKGYTPGSMYKN